MPSRLKEWVERSAAPFEVSRALVQLAEDQPGAAERIGEDDDLGQALVQVMAASRSLARLCRREPTALEVLASLDRPGPEAPGEGSLPITGAADPEDLGRRKHLGLLRIAARDLLGLDSLEKVAAELSDLADSVLERSLALATESLANADPAALAIIAMGKLGGQELNYASDIDIMFVSDDPRSTLNLEFMQVARHSFRVDADLRPEGRSGALARSLDSYEAYWDRWAKTWEFQALLKARFSAGDGDLGRAFEARAADHLWGRAFGAEEIYEVRSMKGRAEAETGRRGLSEREVKRGRGGIRDIEFAVQLLQLVHGRSDPAIRGRNTLATLAELSHAGYVSNQDADELSDAYRFLRQVEHRLQLVEEAQSHTVPTQAGPLDHLARVMGFRDDPARTGVEAFMSRLRLHQAAARTIHERLFFRPLLEVFTSSPGASTPRPDSPGASTLEPAAAVTRLGAFGFADVERTRQALNELTRGLTRSSRLMQALLPVLLGWLSESPDPELGLLGLRTLASGPHRRDRLVTTFRESPEAARRLCRLIGTSRLVLDPIARNPDLIAELATREGMATRTRQELAERAQTALDWRQGKAGPGPALVRLRQTETTRIAIGDILGSSRTSEVGPELTHLAEVVLETALGLVEPPVPMSVVAMGRFGGGELSYASDLDILIVYDGLGGKEHQKAVEAAEAMIRLVHGATPSERIFTLDTTLRPEGKQGPVARSLGGFSNYYERWAQTWERQALLRARPVAGDADLGRRFMELVDSYVFDRPLTHDERREIRRMKARVERERIPAGEDPQFHLKLGRGSLADVEWTAQLLQLESGVRSTGTLLALDLLARTGVLRPADQGVLAEAFRFCEATRNRWFLVHGAPGDSLPSRAKDLTRLARSLDTTPVQLRDDYRRVTRRCRTVVERLFYGRT